MNDSFSLQGKSAIITGATRGIGLAIAEGFLAAGANVTVCSRKQENVDDAVAQLQHPERVLGQAAHVGRSEDIDTLIQAAVERFGGIDILVNNAGTNPYFGPIVESNDLAWDKTMDVNLKGPYIMSRECAKHMLTRKRGSIINISSIAGVQPFPMQGIYSVSKAALIMLTRSMAKELGAANIRVNCICPGLIKTKLSEALWSDPKVEKATTSLKALGRMGTTEEIVGAAIYFASDASSFTTGSVLTVDGGM